MANLTCVGTIGGATDSAFVQANWLNRHTFFYDIHGLGGMLEQIEEALRASQGTEALGR